MQLPESERPWLEEACQKLCRKLYAECARTGSKIPYFPVNGRYVDCIMPDGVSWWTNGFWPGMLWQMYHFTGEPCYRSAAEGVEARLADALCEFTRLHHDVGSMFIPSSVANYRLTGSEEARRRALHAANLLAGRFNPAGNYIRAWNESIWQEDVSGWMIIDCLLNLPLLYWASEETGDPRFADIAMRHTDTALRTILRPDGSCHHIAEFDPRTGDFLKGVGGQGWALYGFALAYRHTGRQEYLDAAKRSAHYCIACLAVNGWLPAVDFRAPAGPVRYDSGAGAIIACGLLELAEHLPAPEQPLCRTAALRILHACEDAFVNWDPDVDGLLFQGATMYHNDRLGDQAFIYGDYFYLEALLRLKGKALPLW